MTIKEAVEKKIKRIKLPEWGDTAYIELNYLENGDCDFFVTMHDFYGQAELTIHQVEGETQFVERKEPTDEKK